MVGLLRWNQEGRFLRPIPLREVNILHVRFLCADMSRGERMSAAAERRKLRSAGKKLLRQGIERAVLPSDVPADALPEGLRPAGTLPLRRAIAADWCGALLRLRGENPAAARVLVTANALSGEVVRTVTELALRHRYLLMEVPYGGEELCRRLRREYGGLRVQPCIPGAWKELTLTRTFRGCWYHIHIFNTGSGKPEVTVDGNRLADTLLPVLNDGQIHEVVVRT